MSISDGRVESTVPDLELSGVLICCSLEDACEAKACKEGAVFAVLSFKCEEASVRSSGGRVRGAVLCRLARRLTCWIGLLHTGLIDCINYLLTKKISEGRSVVVL